jgi:tRNA1(Val) A37 N6-methylase TrmN6
LGLLLCSKNQNCHVTGVELDQQAHLEALENIRRNKLESRMESICADLRSVSERFSPGSFSCCVSNPPYFSAGPASQKTPLARRDDMLSPDALFAGAAWALRYGGDFFLVHKPEMLAQLCALGAKHNLQAKRLCLLRHKENGPVALVLLQLRKGAKPGLVWQEEALYHADGTPTAYYRRLYKEE